MRVLGLVLSMVEVLDTLMLPVWFWYGIAFVFGAVIGSFLNVYIYRFHTGKSLNGRSHCLSCGTPLQWYELFPLLSYLVLRGRCRSCGSYITQRYLWVELCTALLFVAALAVATSVQEFVWLLFVIAVLLVIAVYDYHHFIIPDELTGVLLLLQLGWLGYSWWNGLSLEVVGWHIGASVVGMLFFLLLWLVTRGRALGFGDVKLALPLGLLVGASYVFSFVVLSFWVGAIISAGIVLYQRYGRGKHSLHLTRETLTMKSAVPFAPFMIVGALAVYFLRIDVLTLFSFVS